VSRTSESGRSKAKRSAANSRNKRKSAKTIDVKIGQKKKPVEERELTTEESAQLMKNGPSPKALKSFQRAQKKSRELSKKSTAKKSKKNFIAKNPRRGRKYSLDLRIQSPASDGFFSTGGVELEPALIRLAEVKGIDLLGITDFHNVAFVDRLQEASQSSKVTVIPGFIVACAVGNCSEVYMIALFPETCGASDLYAVLDELGIPQSERGSREYRVQLDFEEVLGTVEAAGGVLIPSRMDKTPHRQLAISELVESYGFHAFDLVHPENTAFFEERWPDGEFTFFSFSNANALAQVGTRYSKVKLEDGGFSGLAARVERRLD